MTEFVYNVISRFHDNADTYTFKNLEDAKKKTKELQLEMIRISDEYQGSIEEVEQKILAKTGKTDIYEAVDEIYNDMTEYRYSSIDIKKTEIL